MNISEKKLIKRKMKTILEECLFRVIPQGFSSTNAIANAGLSRFHRDRLCSLKHLKSLHTFPEKSGQVPDSSGQDVLADS